VKTVWLFLEKPSENKKKNFFATDPSHRKVCLPAPKGKEEERGLGRRNVRPKHPQGMFK
jgi:hypothetical protein